MKRPALQNEQVGVLRMAFRPRKVFGTFEKRAPGAYPMREFSRKCTKLVTANGLPNQDGGRGDIKFIVRYRFSFVERFSRFERLCKSGAALMLS